MSFVNVLYLKKSKFMITFVNVSQVWKETDDITSLWLKCKLKIA